MNQETIHVLHVPISLPLLSRQATGTYIVDLIDAMDAADGLEAGVVHVNPFGLLSGVKNKWLNRLKKQAMAHLRRKVLFDRPTFFPLDKRASARWIKYTLEAVDNYVASYGMPDVVHCHSGRGAGEVGLALGYKFNLPFVVQEHNPVYLSGDLTAHEEARLMRVYESADSVCPVSSPMRKVIDRLVGDTDVTPVPNIVNAVFENGPINPPPRGRRIDNISLAMVARLDGNKNVEMGIEALARMNIKGATLNIVGVGPLEAHLKGIAYRLGVNEQVNFLGYQSREYIRKLLDRSDLLLVCSRKESFGVPVLEALFCGCAVVSTRCGGPEEIAERTLGVYLIEGDDARAMALRIDELMNAVRSFEAREKIRSEALGRYGADAIVSTWREIYAQTICRKT